MRTLSSLPLFLFILLPLLSSFSSSPSYNSSPILVLLPIYITTLRLSPCNLGARKGYAAANALPAEHTGGGGGACGAGADGNFDANTAEGGCEGSHAQAHSAQTRAGRPAEPERQERR